jgi:predicted RNase H-like nuclease (RuvC/YqgF family)
MSQGAFDFNEFIEPKKNQVVETVEVVEENTTVENEPVEETVEEFDCSEDIDVQKAVVESLAADKAALDCEIDNLKNTLTEKDSKLAERENEISSLKEVLSKKDFEISFLKVELAKKDSELAKNLEKQLDAQERNPNALALLDREVELPDRFPGETRDHVLEVIKEARDKAESEGRRRRAQILESVLVANEPNGTLAERRLSVEKVFAENNNIISGAVIEKLTEFELSHKEGEEYLLASEILLRNF